MTSSEKKSRLPRLKRTPQNSAPRFRLTARDKAIVDAVYTHRALTAPQIAALFFASPSAATSSRCRHRLKLLYHHGFLHRIEQPQILSAGREPLVYFLDKRGAQMLAVQQECEVEDLDWRERENKVGYRFIEHLLLSNDVRIAITKATQRQEWTIEQWIDEQSLRRTHIKEYVTIIGAQGSEQRVALIPDGYFVLATPEHRYHHFLEIDLRTETGEASVAGRKDWARKMKAYISYYTHGHYQERYKTTGGRVLTITTGEKRMAHLKQITEKVGGRSRFWFTTFERLNAQTVLSDPIWQVAAREDYFSLVF